MLQLRVHTNVHIRASLVAQMVKNLPAMQKMRVRSLGQKNPLEKKMASHSDIFAWEIPRCGGCRSLSASCQAWGPRGATASLRPALRVSQRQVQMVSSPQCPASASHPQPLRFCQVPAQSSILGVPPTTREPVGYLPSPPPTPGTWEGDGD